MVNICKFTCSHMKVNFQPVVWCELYIFVSYWYFVFSSVLFISLHRYEYGSFYPASEDGSEKKVGEGDGEGYNVNIAWNNVGIIWTVLMSEWVIDCCLTPTQPFFSYIIWEQVNFQWNDDEVRFVLNQHA